MLTWLYADNYKCLLNFELKPQRLMLLMGRNGTGKSALFEVLRQLRAFALGDTDASTAFPLDSRTRWDTRSSQTFEISASGLDGDFRYRAVFDPWGRPEKTRVVEETLRFDEQPLFNFLEGEVQLFRDNGTQGPRFSSDWSRSSLARVPPGPDNAKLTWFKDWLRRLWVVAPDPRAMTSESRQTEEEPASSLSNFASWYAHNIQEYPSVNSDYLIHLRSALDGFEELTLKRSGERSRTLTLMHAAETGEGHRASTKPYEFEELSDGQRMLIALYAVLDFGTSAGVTLCVDEPDNYVALSEIQPWLVALREKIEGRGGQALVISHHPETINYLAPTAAKLFERVNGGPTRVRDFVADSESGLSSAETIARGWE